MKTTHRLLPLAAICGLLASAPTGDLLAAVQLPASSAPNYTIPDASNNLWTTFSLLTCGDTAPNGYRFVGIPDGTGAYDNNDGTFTVLINHELGATQGIVRAHGGRGAFVSKWVVRKSDYAVLSGEDLIRRVRTWSQAAGTWVDGTGAALAFGRFCSADLPEVSAFFNSATGRGTQARIFMNGEENGAEGRGMAHVVTGPDAGTSYELPATGKFSWENSVACPFRQDKTIVIGTDDGTGGQVYIYIGTKQSAGNDVVRAGLSGGNLYAVRIEGMPTEPTTAFTRAQRTQPFSLVNHGDVTNSTGAALDAQSVALGATSFLRPEDGGWNPSNPSEFYFVTTSSFTTPCRLWVLKFRDIANPEAGGTIEMLWDGSNDGDRSARMFDNLVVNSTGQVLLQEDPGNQSYLARMHTYDIAKKTLRPIAIHTPTFFTAGSPNFITADEETSGIIDISGIMGTPDTYLYVDQVHAAPSANAAEVVERGQLCVISPSTRHSTISTRGRVTPGNPLIAGFTISGTETKTVLVRALGTSLSRFGVTGGIANSRLQLFRGSVPVAENNDWKFNPNADAITAAGLAPFADSDSAVLLSLAPGNYTVIVQDDAGGSGTALVDAYEFDLTPGHTQARVANLSARGGVGTGEGALIVGFSVDGREDKRVLIRALGPTLTGFGVTGALGDTRLRLFRGATLVASNDDWSQDAASAALFGTSSALRPGSSVESTLVQTLAPGTYTVVVDGANAATGTALIDVNEL